MVEFRHVTAGYGGQPILKDLSFSIPKGKITSLVGPNGCGKTTLLRAAARQLPLLKGEILLENLPLFQYGRKQFARTAAFLPQMRSIPSITVERLVSHGRFPYLGLSRKMRVQDRQAVKKAMESTGISQWATKDLTELSGGQRQRVYIAMVLAQDPDIIFLDEPTTYLDLKHQFELLELLQNLHAEGKTIVMVLHDLSHALRYSHRIVLLEEGRLVADDTPDVLFQKKYLDRVFQVHTHRAEDAYYFTP